MDDDLGKKECFESESRNSTQLFHDEKIPYPKSVFFILSTEACERFSYYGMRAILSLYLRHLYTSSGMETEDAEDLSTIIYHSFVFLSYFTSIFGAFLADSFLGKFKTIFYISIIYAIGQCVLSYGAIPGPEEDDFISGNPQKLISYLGLILIGFGTGGIKPCVVSFGADQFVLPQQNDQMQTFFGIFYASINFGSMLSTIMTPIFRRQPCFGEEECYTLAFGVPAILMIVAIIFFLLGRPGYKISIPERNIVKEFLLCIWEALKQKFRNKEIKREHWLDFAEEKFGKIMVSDVKAVLRVAILFLLYPVFWALYDQQGSRWTFQATRMNGKIGSIIILPDQMQVINAALILLFIPLFDKIIYPAANKIGLLTKPLQKIVTGGILLACAFIISGFLELIIQKTYPDPPNDTKSRLGIHNSIPKCDLEFRIKTPNNDDFVLFAKSGKSSVAKDGDEKYLFPYTFFENEIIQINSSYSLKGSKCDYQTNSQEFHFSLKSHNSTTIWAYVDKNNHVQMQTNVFTDEVDKSETGNPWIKIYYYLPEANNETLTIVSNDNYKDDDERKGQMSRFQTQNTYASDAEADPTSKMGEFKTCVYNYGNNSKICVNDSYNNIFKYDYKYGGSYNQYLWTHMNNTEIILNMEIEIITEPNKIHMLWLLPQYIVLTAGEVLFSITSLEFSFTQAPTSMKAVVQSLYLLTTAFGNLIDIFVIASLSGVFSSQAYEFFLFAFLMLLDMLILAFLSTRYNYVDYTGLDLQQKILHETFNTQNTNKSE